MRLDWEEDSEWIARTESPHAFRDNVCPLNKPQGRRSLGLCDVGAEHQGGMVQGEGRGAASHCSKELRADLAWVLKFVTSLDSTFQSLPHLAEKFMRTGFLSGVLALSLHVLIGTREAVSAKRFCTLE